MAATAAVALLAFGVAADGLGASPTVAQSPEAPAQEGTVGDPPDLWEFPACDPCEVDTQPLVGTAADNLPPVVLVGLVLLGAFAVAGVWVRAGGGDDGVEPSAAGDDAVASARPTAGSAPTHDVADDVPLTNDVYRAWRSMADRLGGDRALTPGEYAAAAREAGLDPDAVATLTDLFREVRYGGVDPDADRERRAREAKAALERADADERSDDPLASGEGSR